VFVVAIVQLFLFALEIFPSSISYLLMIALDSTWQHKALFFYAAETVYKFEVARSSRQSVATHYQVLQLVILNEIFK